MLHVECMVRTLILVIGCMIGSTACIMDGDDDSRQIIRDNCHVGGCSSQLCGDEPEGSTCEWIPEYECYRSATCERQDDGACGWTETPDLEDCVGQSRRE